ncbi:MAG: radical SAM family heme chaperone HemW [Pseudomonadales bacterium]|nr:radical SAM family heme chaperone HemW [Pseudomonadales bacterium]
MLIQPPLSLYIHFPWCVRKCPYCDFNSHETNAIPETEYINALLNDFHQDASLWQGRELKSIFMGGGTPSLFSAKAIDELLKQLRQNIDFAPDIEITLEANPGTFEQEKFAGYHAAGINRLSVGVQSFNSEHLSTLGRIHTADEASQAMYSLRSAGFNNFNIDIMHGLPNQSIEQALADLQQAITLKPTHLSWYQLTIEPNTIFYSKPPRLPKDEILWQIQETGQDLLAANGYEQYEISAYSQDERQSKHNLNYWRFGDYLALGAGAHGKITDSKKQQIIRYQKTRLPKDYLNSDKVFTASQKTIDCDELNFEFFMNGFRLNQGVSKSDYECLTGLKLEHTNKPIEKAIALGLLQETATAWIPTEQGRLYLNDLLQLFLD